MPRMRRSPGLGSALMILACARTLAGPCSGTGLELQVLGSGGPELPDQRASSSYLVWLDGKPRVLVDSGGGSALRFGQAGAHVAQLDAVVFTHLHVDHTADFPALIKSSYFEERERPLPVYGPAGNAFFPSTHEFVADLFDRRRGAYRYLAAFLAGQEGGYVLQVHDVPLHGHAIRAFGVSPGLMLVAAPVTHGDVPALAWRVNLADKSIVFSGDTNGNDGNLERLAAGADLFVAHNAVPEGQQGAPRRLHMPPSVIGRIARIAGVHAVILSHRMLRTLGAQAQTRRAIAATYTGPVTFANDLDCFR